MTEEHLTRDEILRRSFAVGAAMAIPGFWAELAKAGIAPQAVDPKRLKKTLVFSNWPLYMDFNEKTKRHPSLDLFTKRYGVKVKYTEDIGDNAEFFGKIQAPLSRGRSIGRDLIAMTDNSPYPALLIKKGWVQKIDKSVLPNLKNVQAALKHPSFDPNHNYTMPWQSGMTGIAYNSKLTKPVTSIDQLLTDKKLKGKITLLSSLGDTLPLVVLSNGDNPSKIDDAAFNRALKKLKKALGSGQIRQFTGNNYAPLLKKGDVAAAVAWSGDIFQLQDKKLHWVLPKAGGAIWTDHMLIPRGGDAYTASVYMNFVFDPKIAAIIDGDINYISPVKGAAKVLLKADPKRAKNVLLFPTPAMQAKLHIVDSNALFNPDYKVKWQKLLGA